MQVNRPHTFQAAQDAAPAMQPQPGGGDVHPRTRRGLFSGVVKPRLPSFKPPLRVHGKIGYPMGPIRPPKMPRLSTEPPTTTASTPAAPARATPATASPGTTPANGSQPSSSGTPAGPPAGKAPPSRSAEDIAQRRTLLFGTPRKDFVNLTGQHVRAWAQLPQAERERLGIAGFAKENNLDPVLLGKAVHANGDLSWEGMKLLDRIPGPSHPPPL